MARYFFNLGQALPAGMQCTEKLELQYHKKLSQLNQCQELIDAVRAGDIDQCKAILKRRPMAIKTQEPVLDHSVIHIAVINRDYPMLEFLRK